MKLFGVAADLAKDIASKGASLAPDMFVADEAAEQSILCATCGRQNPDTGLLFRYCSSCGSLLERQALRPEEVARALIVLPSDVARGWKSFKVPDGRSFGVRLPTDAQAGVKLLVGMPKQSKKEGRIDSAFKMLEFAVDPVDWADKLIFGDDVEEQELRSPSEWVRIVAAQAPGNGKGGKDGKGMKGQMPPMAPGLPMTESATRRPQMPMVPGRPPQLVASGLNCAGASYPGSAPMPNLPSPAERLEMATASGSQTDSVLPSMSGLTDMAGKGLTGLWKKAEGSMSDPKVSEPSVWQS